MRLLGLKIEIINKRDFGCPVLGLSEKVSSSSKKQKKKWLTIFKLFNLESQCY